jgi:hypothetical protein
MADANEGNARAPRTYNCVDAMETSNCVRVQTILFSTSIATRTIGFAEA